MAKQRCLPLNALDLLDLATLWQGRACERGKSQDRSGDGSGISSIGRLIRPFQLSLTKVEYSRKGDYSDLHINGSLFGIGD